MYRRHRGSLAAGSTQRIRSQLLRHTVTDANAPAGNAQQEKGDYCAGIIARRHKGLCRFREALRLPLGQTTLKTIQMKLDSVQNDLEASRKVAEMVIF